MSQAVPSADEVRHRLYEIMAADQPFEERAQEALELGTRYLDVDTGFVSRIDPSTDSWETIVSTDGDDGLVPTGLKTDLDGTYCRHTLERDSPLAVDDAMTDERIEDPDESIHCYHGTTLTVDDEVYGTVCFVAAEPRGEPFSEAETMFAELVGRLLEHELEHEKHQNELERKTNLVNVLDRVLRHNIRNDLTVIRANAELHADTHAESTEAETIVTKANELIETSETARRLGRIINDEFEPQPVDVVDTAREVLAEAAKTYAEATFELHAPDELPMLARPSLETALGELVENASEYAGDGPRVAVRIEQLNDCVQICVEDDGPGLPKPEQDALQAGTETSLVHGSGLGLWAVYWAVLTHQGELTIDSEDGTTVCMEIPWTDGGAIDTEPAEHGQEDAEDPESGSGYNRDESSTGRQIPRAPGRYRAIFENAQFGMALVDDDNHFVDLNDAARELLGAGNRTVVGRPATEFLVAESGGDGGIDIPQEGAVTVQQIDAGKKTLEYVVSRSILPGQHLVVFRDAE
jgi:GAF domain-containing protein/anti-sigma regulatory factor (Ser/Thr protein kinase)